MQKKHSFLQSTRNKRYLGIAACCIMIVIMFYGTFEKSESKTTAIVYAEGKTMAAPAERIEEETAEDAQIPLDEEQNIHLEESAQAMQLSLASEIADQVRVERKQEENRIHLSTDDMEILLRIVEAEATGEDIEGKMLVANVVLNRVNSKEFPNTVKKVVFAHRQFSPIRDGRYYKVKITKETRKAVERVLNGEDESKGAVYFMSRKQANKKNVSWFDRELTKVKQHGTHEFFK